MARGRKPKYYGEKPLAVTLCTPQIYNGLIWAGTRAWAVKSQQLIAWATSFATLPIQIRFILHGEHSVFPLERQVS